MSKKVTGFARVEGEFDERYAQQLKDTIYVTVELVGDESAYRNSYDTKEDAVEADGGEEPAIVATYKLVKVEFLKLKRLVQIVEE